MINEQIRAAIARDHGTLYRAALIVGAETDETIQTVHSRLTTYTSETPVKTIRQLEETLKYLGYRLQLERIDLFGN